MYTQWNAINTHSIRRTLPERRKKKRENWWKTTKYDRFAFTVAATAAAADFAAVRIPPKLPLWSPNRTSNAHGVKMFYGANKLDLWHCGMYNKMNCFLSFRLRENGFQVENVVSVLISLRFVSLRFVSFRFSSYLSHRNYFIIFALFLDGISKRWNDLISVFASEMRSTIWTRREEVSDHGTMTYAR